MSKNSRELIEEVLERAYAQHGIEFYGEYRGDGIVVSKGNHEWIHREFISVIEDKCKELITLFESGEIENDDDCLMCGGTGVREVAELKSPLFFEKVTCEACESGKIKYKGNK